MTAFIGNFCFFPAIFLLNFFTKKPGGGVGVTGRSYFFLFVGLFVSPTRQKKTATHKKHKQPRKKTPHQNIKQPQLNK
ncbi:hypothetical protein, partial [Enterobacter sichuanensis]